MKVLTSSECSLWCNECGTDVRMAIEIGESPADHMSATATLCLSCLREAVALAEGAE